MPNKIYILSMKMFDFGFVPVAMEISNIMDVTKHFTV